MKTMSFTNEEVKFLAQGKERGGILTRPEGVAHYPAIVLLHGADRSSARDPYYVTHAENLVRAGYAVLRYDGPGWGGGPDADSGFETLESRTEEAIAAVQYLQSRADINPNAVGLFGISQGGWICQMAAAAYNGIAFIIPVSGPGVTPAEQEVYRVEAESRAEGFTEDEIAKAVLMRRLMVDITMPEPRYRAINLSEAERLGVPWSEVVAVTYASTPVDLQAEFGRVIATLDAIKDEHWSKYLHVNDILSVLGKLPPQAWGMAKAQMRTVMEVDPANFLTKVHCPVLAIFGADDTSIPVNKSVDLYKRYLGAAGNEALTIKVFPNASHTIRISDEFAAGYFDLMMDWLRNLSA